MLLTYLMVIPIIVKIEKKMQNEVWWYNYYLQNFTSTLFLGCVYIPPENTRYASESCFTEIGNDIIYFSQKSKFVALVGDFNARTAKLSDYIIPDENLLHDILILRMMK